MKFYLIFIFSAIILLLLRDKFLSSRVKHAEDNILSILKTLSRLQPAMENLKRTPSPTVLSRTCQETEITAESIDDSLHSAADVQQPHPQQFLVEGIEPNLIPNDILNLLQGQLEKRQNEERVFIEEMDQDEGEGDRVCSELDEDDEELSRIQMNSPTSYKEFDIHEVQTTLSQSSVRDEDVDQEVGVLTDNEEEAPPPVS